MNPKTMNTKTMNTETPKNAGLSPGDFVRWNFRKSTFTGTFIRAEAGCAVVDNIFRYVPTGDNFRPQYPKRPKTSHLVHLSIIDKTD